MAVLEILTYPDEALHKRCSEVTAFDAGLHKLLDDMAQTMQSQEGIGLAANQVGELRRLFLMDVPLGKDAQTGAELRTGLLEIINPRIANKRGEVRFEEGCLSFPGIYENVIRANEIELHWQDRTGAPQQAKLQGLVAICAQHEFDHLEGITFVERLSPLKRRLALREYERANRESIEDKQFRAKARQRRQPQQLS